MKAFYSQDYFSKVKPSILLTQKYLLANVLDQLAPGEVLEHYVEGLVVLEGVEHGAAKPISLELDEDFSFVEHMLHMLCALYT